jgi:hypothetical protein
MAANEKRIREKLKTKWAKILDIQLKVSRKRLIERFVRIYKGKTSIDACNY